MKTSKRSQWYFSGVSIVDFKQVNAAKDVIIFLRMEFLQLEHDYFTIEVFMTLSNTYEGAFFFSKIVNE